jgi:hypothetical protein
MTEKPEKTFKKIDPKDFQINIDELKNNTQRIVSESTERIDPKDFQKNIDELKNSTQRIVTESTERMKKYRI